MSLLSRKLAQPRRSWILGLLISSLYGVIYNGVIEFFLYLTVVAENSLQLLQLTESQKHVERRSNCCLHGVLNGWNVTKFEAVVIHVNCSEHFHGLKNQMDRGQAIAFYVTISCVAFVASKIFIALLLYKRWKRRHMIYEDGISGGKMVMFKSPTTKSLKSDAFLKKTLKLNNKDIIGSGGHGTVYKLALDDSITFAVKRLNRGSAERDQGFERELEAMGDIKHRNIVTLHGYYTAPHYNLLIYELMPNGSLYAYLHGRSNEKVLDWPSRYKIAVGAARGISYLHHDCIPHIIHRDIKSSNILLDQNMDAQVSDFGLATLMEPDKTHVSTIVAGTFGYLAPEYFDTGRATVKGDVYSFGVVLLELLTGKKPTDEAFMEEGTKLVTWVKTVVREKREEYVLDSSLGCCPVDEVNGVFSIAMKCLEPEPTQRPTMAEVVKVLEQIRSNSIETDS